jgi:hypothetical protein
MQDTPREVRFIEQVDYDRHEAASGRLALIGLTALLTIIVFVVSIYWLYTVTYDKVEYDQYAGVTSKELLDIRERENEQLHKFGYINKEKGVVRLSLERAMELVAGEAAQGRVTWNTRTYAAQPEPDGGARAMSWSPDGTGRTGTAPLPEAGKDHVAVQKK